MKTNLLDLYEQASDWTLGKVQGAASKLDDRDAVRRVGCAPPHEPHARDAEVLRQHTARGAKASPPSGDPPDLLSKDPVADFKLAQANTLSTFGQPGVIDKTGPSLGITFADQLLRGWDLAKATRQDTTMPKGLPEAAYEMIHGRFTDEQRKGVFKPEVPVSADPWRTGQAARVRGRDPRSA